MGRDYESTKKIDNYIDFLAGEIMIKLSPDQQGQYCEFRYEDIINLAYSLIDAAIRADNIINPFTCGHNSSDEDDMN